MTLPRCPLCDKGMTLADLAMPALMLGTEFRIRRNGETFSHVVCCECTPRIRIDGIGHDPYPTAAPENVDSLDEIEDLS